jgi:hypothetical protein
VNPSLLVVSQLLEQAGYQVEPRTDRDGVLGEDPARVVWSVYFPGVLDLLERWEEEQAWLVGVTQDLSLEKSWELYLVLLCGPRPDRFERRSLDAIRRDTGYARKVIVPGADHLLASEVAGYMAPLNPLDVEVQREPIDALAQLEEKARREENEDAIKVLAAFRKNQPLFDDL